MKSLRLKRGESQRRRKWDGGRGGGGGDGCGDRDGGCVCGTAASVAAAVVTVVDLGFTMLLTSQVISVAIYSDLEKSKNFAQKL